MAFSLFHFQFDDEEAPPPHAIVAGPEYQLFGPAPPLFNFHLSLPQQIPHAPPLQMVSAAGLVPTQFQFQLNAGPLFLFNAPGRPFLFNAPPAQFLFNVPGRPFLFNAPPAQFLLAGPYHAPSALELNPEAEAGPFLNQALPEQLNPAEAEAGLPEGISLEVKRSKMLLCSDRFGPCRGDWCDYSHSEAEVSLFRRRTRFCRLVDCAGGCNWAHNVAELEAHSYMKTQICARFIDGNCPEQLCDYAHGEHELRE